TALLHKIAVPKPSDAVHATNVAKDPIMTTDVLRIEKLHVSYRGVKAIDGLSLQAPTGQMTCIVGPNGSGKSTTLKASLGLVQASHGTVKFFDKPVAK